MKNKKRNPAVFLCLSLLFFVALETKPNNLPWYFAPNDVEACWNRDITGRHVVVYLLDSPVLMVKSLEGKVLKEVSYVQSELSEVMLMHGTAMAGLIVSDPTTLDDSQNSGQKLTIAGISPGSKIVSYSSSNARGFFESMRSVYDAVQVLKNKHGKRLTPSEEDVKSPFITIVSVPGGVPKNALSSAEVVRDLIGEEVLIVAAVGNSAREITKRNSHQGGVFPANKRRHANPEQEIIIRVAALSRYSNESLATLYTNSNYGKDFTDIGAPGATPILTTDGKASMSVGSSNAAAVVSGTLALMLSCNPYSQSSELRRALLASAHKNDGLREKILDGNILIISHAVQRFCFKHELPNLEQEPLEDL